MVAYKRYHQLKRAGKLNLKQEQVRKEAVKARKIAHGDAPMQDSPSEPGDEELLEQAMSFFGEHPELLTDNDLSTGEDDPPMGFSPPMPPPSPPSFQPPPSPGAEPEVADLEPSFQNNPATEVARPPNDQPPSPATEPPSPPGNSDSNEQPQGGQLGGGSSSAANPADKNAFPGVTPQCWETEPVPANP